MEVGLVKRIDIDDEMQQAYLDYAMSVIVARALPDARDGLKPVHRRILYAMHDMGLRADSAYKKSARIVGEVLGKYHPHGDMAVYEAMARMAQDFSMRYLLVDGQGNFGSVDGDPPAAMRYTEARLADLAQFMLADIQKNTVDFVPNFDDTLEEPTVLPSALPNMLVNGATGIAVGMATSIPPHNLGEVVDALRYMLENWNKLDDITVEDLMRFIQGPDFPTGGIILEESAAPTVQDPLGTAPADGGLLSAYGSGRGRVTVQARAHSEEMERGRSRIIVTELPYMTNKASLIERIAELVREEKLEGISDLRDESDRQGMRIVIELNKNADPEATLRNLYKHTPMQGTFSMILLALVDGEPRLLSLKQALRVYLDHRLEIVKRRSQHDLDKARARAHILEGLRIALKNLDEIIDLIRKAPDVETARARLIKRFKLSEIQANAILDMQLRRLAALERKKIEEEYKAVQAQIKELETLLRSPVKMRGVVSDELQAVRETYGDRRRTQIVRVKAGEGKRTLLTAHDLTPAKTVWLAVTADGKISRSHDETQPPLTNEMDLRLRFLAKAGARDTLYLAAENGEAAAMAVATVPEAASPANGVPLAQISALKDPRRLAAVFSLPPRADRPEGQHLLTVSRQGMVKKSAVADLPGPSAGLFTLVRVNEGDRLGWAQKISAGAEILCMTTGGMAIRFSEEEVRPMGLVAAGVMGMKLQNGDELAGVAVLPPPGEALPKGTALFMVASDGMAKRVPLDEFPRQGRYGQGVSAWKLPKARVVGLGMGPKDAQAILHLERGAQIVRLDAAPTTGRAARGGRVVDVKARGEVVRVLVVEGARGDAGTWRHGDTEKDGRGPKAGGGGDTGTQGGGETGTRRGKAKPARSGEAVNNGSPGKAAYSRTTKAGGTGVRGEAGTRSAKSGAAKGGAATNKAIGALTGGRGGTAKTSRTKSATAEGGSATTKAVSGEAGTLGAKTGSAKGSSRSKTPAAGEAKPGRAKAETAQGGAVTNKAAGAGTRRGGEAEKGQAAPKMVPTSQEKARAVKTGVVKESGAQTKAAAAGVKTTVTKTGTSKEGTAQKKVTTNRAKSQSAKEGPAARAKRPAAEPKEPVTQMKLDLGQAEVARSKVPAGKGKAGKVAPSEEKPAKAATGGEKPVAAKRGSASTSKAGPGEAKPAAKRSSASTAKEGGSEANAAKPVPGEKKPAARRGSASTPTGGGSTTKSTGKAGEAGSETAAKKESSQAGKASRQKKTS